MWKRCRRGDRRKATKWPRAHEAGTRWPEEWLRSTVARVTARRIHDVLLVLMLRIYADFNGLVSGPRNSARTAVVLDTMGSVRDLSNAGVVLTEGLELIGVDWSDESEDLEGHGTAQYDRHNRWWVIEFDERGVQYVPAGDRSVPASFLCVVCRSDVIAHTPFGGPNQSPAMPKSWPDCSSCGARLDLPIVPPSEFSVGARMALKVTIVRWVSDDFPGFVECRVRDAHGAMHVFHEKVPVVTRLNLTGESPLPRDTAIACEVVRSRTSESGGRIITIDVEHPWGLETLDGLTVLDVAAEQLLEMER